MDVAASQPLIRIAGVDKLFANGTLALSGLNLEMAPREFVSLLGPSGCGKSTALRMIAGLTSPSRGTIEWPGAQSGKGPGGKGHGVDLGFVFQEPTLMPWRTVFGNVYLPLRMKGVSKSAARPVVDEALARVGVVGVRAILSAAIVRRHEDAGVDRPRAGDQPDHAADGRAVRRPR
jgi:NitT/TauT family transport system ATP-binding protein